VAIFAVFAGGEGYGAYSKDNKMEWFFFAFSYPIHSLLPPVVDLKKKEF
jgi:hypothetical protein